MPIVSNVGRQCIAGTARAFLVLRPSSLPPARPLRRIFMIEKFDPGVMVVQAAEIGLLNFMHLSFSSAIVLVRAGSHITKCKQSLVEICP
jgi:hypothetical protein